MFRNDRSRESLEGKAMTDDLRLVESFLYYEAALLDDRRFKEWLELFPEDAHYWMPMRSTREWGTPDVSGPRDLAFFDDDRHALELRVERLFTEFAWAEDPPSRTRHLITNVRIDAGESSDSELLVRSNFLLYRNRLNSVEHSFVGSREDLLRRKGESFEIARRKIVLDVGTLPADNLSVFF
jgi:3-phenylpropionate/cinnamic acid dioxygenase small subunit